jgi:hypothetical protein
MPTIKETYDLPDRPPVAVRLWIIPGLITIAALGGWFVLPHTPAIAGLLVLVVIVAVGAAIMRVMTSRELSELPRRRPVKPPSTGGD